VRQIDRCGGLQLPPVARVVELGAAWRRGRRLCEVCQLRHRMPFRHTLIGPVKPAAARNRPSELNATLKTWPGPVLSVLSSAWLRASHSWTVGSRCGGEGALGD
jgi:hypothetical protein